MGSEENERWRSQRHAVAQQQSDLRSLQSQNQQLRGTIKRLHDPAALEIEARKLGMIRRGERAYVVQNLPKP